MASIAVEPGVRIELFPGVDEGVVGEEVGIDGGEIGDNIPEELPNDDCGIGYAPEDDDVGAMRDPTGDDSIMDDARECPLLP